MNERSLSEKLDALALRLETVIQYFSGWDDYHDEAEDIVKELRQLSKETYAPGNTVSWADLKPKAANKTYTNKSGRKLPF